MATTEVTLPDRTDAELAIGAPTPVEADLAVGGVDEILVTMLAGDWSTSRMMRRRDSGSRSPPAGEPGAPRSSGSR